MHRLVRITAIAVLTVALAAAAWPQTNGTTDGTTNGTTDGTTNGTTDGTTNGTSESAYGIGMLARKIIHMDAYLPTPGDVYTLTVNYGVNPMMMSAGQAFIPTQQFSMVLQSDYTLELPYIGRFDASDLTYLEMRTRIIERVKDRALAEFVGFDLSEPAVFDVFVWGNIASPGYHLATALMRVSELIAAAGGRVREGTQRRVVVRNGEDEAEYDLLSHIVRGETGQDPLLVPGDQVFIPSAERTVALRGAVIVPGTYEILANETLADVIAFAGGLKPTALVDKLRIDRLNENNRYATIDVEDTSPEELVLEDGDRISIPSSTTTSETITVEGAVFTSPAESGTYRSIPRSPVVLDIPYTPGVTLLSLLEELGGPTPYAIEQDSFVIRGETGERLPIPDLATIWTERQYDRDIVLRPGDYVVIPQQDLSVRVTGLVNAPGAFGFTSGYTVGDYIMLAGGINPTDGSESRIYFRDAPGELTGVAMGTPVPPGTTIFVDRNIWGGAKVFFSNVFVVTGWVTGVLGAVTTIINFVQLFSGN